MKKENTPSLSYGRRIAKLQTMLDTRHMQAFLIEKASNIFYLTGFPSLSETEREALLLVTKAHTFLAIHPLHSFNSPTTACTVLTAEKGDFYTTLLSKIPAQKKLYFEQSIPHNQYLYLKKHARTTIVEPTHGLVEDLRTIKDTYELSALKHADRTTREVLQSFLKKLSIDKTEQQTAFSLKQQLEQKTQENVAFPPIIASGIHSAIPHHAAGLSKISDITIVDCGAKYQGYCADITRTMYRDTKKQKLLRTMYAVEEAYKVSYSQIRVGMKSKDAFKIAFDVLKKYDLHTFFIHSLGHGVGIDIHELPHLSPTSNEILMSGMVFSLEPGVYIPGQFGVRYENTVVLTDKGCIELNF